MNQEENNLLTLKVGQYYLNGSMVFIGRGFGYQRDDNGIPVYRKHDHIVKISETAFIGNGANIDIGRDRDTEIRDYTVIDSLVHIGHSAIIGKKCIIISGAIIGGHVEISDGCYIGPNVFIKQGIKIGKGVFIGPSSYVTKDIPDHEAWYGVPAKRHPEIEDHEYILRSVWR